MIERFRGLLLTGIPFLLLLMAWYAETHRPFVGLPETRSQPEAFEGREIFAGVEVRVREIRDSSFAIEQRGHCYEVLGELPDAQPGDYVALVVRFHAGGPLELVRGRVMKNRREKILVSTIPAIFVLALLLRDYRWDAQARRVRRGARA